MTTIGKGIFSIDDHIRFGKTCDQLSEFCYLIMYLPSQDVIVVSAPKSAKPKLQKFNIIEIKEKNIIFAKIKWR